LAQLFSPPPAEQIYQSYLPGKYFGARIEKYFSARFPYFSEEEWVQRITDGLITVNGKRVVPGTVLQEHDFIVTRMGRRQEPPVDRTLDVLFENQHVRIFNKGAPLPVHPCGRYFKNSMTELLKEAYPDEVPRPVQRLDALTTGLVVFAKTRPSAAVLMREFSGNRVQKEYWALVEGVPEKRAFEVNAPIGKVNGSVRAVGPELPNSKSARTAFECLGSRNGRSLLKAMPHTGRTNQIRVHLAHIGLPLVNDPVYGTPSPDLPALGLHATRLRFNCFDDFIDVSAPCPGYFEPYMGLPR